jgi:hypothetical protein
VKIHGHCPMGCGETLMAEDGLVLCAKTTCPDRLRVTQILDCAETEHVVEFAETSFTVQHPLHERAGQLFGCRFHAQLSELGDTGRRGRFRVSYHQVDAYSESYRPGDGPFDFERLDG